MKTSGKKIAQNLVNRLYDDITSRDIRAALQRDAYTKDCKSINITVEKGVATISGDVNNPTEYRRAYEIARRTIGVREISGQLEIKKNNANQTETATQHYHFSLAGMH
jgi:osmotically-inducible protein OsmY